MHYSIGSEGMLPSAVLQQVLGSTNQVKYMANQSGSRLAKALEKAGVTDFNVSMLLVYVCFNYNQGDLTCKSSNWYFIHFSTVVSVFCSVASESINDKLLLNNEHSNSSQLNLKAPENLQVATKEK